MEVYEPREDSFLTQKYVEQLVTKGMLVLDMGTGSGIQAITAAKIGAQVIAVDINPDAVSSTRLSASIEKLKITVIESDLFLHVPKKQFDCIIFNPPYLPQDEEVDDIALVSKKRGIATTEQFLRSARPYLADNGFILLMSSSLADINLLELIMEEELFDFVVLEKQHIFFEDIVLYKMQLKPVVTKLRSKVKNITYFDKGKRGLIYTATYHKKKVAIKTKRDSDAMVSLQNEISFLEKLNKHQIGPQMVDHSKEYLMYYFVEGIFIEEYIQQTTRNNIILVLKQLFDQLHIMDTLGINKLEMHHPTKHILIEKDAPVLIDFERCRFTQKPKNVTQFCDFLTSESMMTLLSKKGITIDKKSLLNTAQQYKKKYDYKLIEDYLSHV